MSDFGHYLRLYDRYTSKSIKEKIQHKQEY